MYDRDLQTRLASIINDLHAVATEHAVPYVAVFAEEPNADGDLLFVGNYHLPTSPEHPGLAAAADLLRDHAPSNAARQWWEGGRRAERFLLQEALAALPPDERAEAETILRKLRPSILDKTG